MADHTAGALTDPTSLTSNENGSAHQNVSCRELILWHRIMSLRAPALPILLALSMLIISACSDAVAPVDLLSPEVPVDVTSIIADPAVNDAALISFAPSAADSVRARYASIDGTDIGMTPWLPADGGRITALGLLPATNYTVVLETRTGGTMVTGTGANFLTPSLPQALASVSLSLISGTPPTSGYTLASLGATNNHGYLIAFDSVGRIRWYRDFGQIDVQEAKQQTNGDFTVFVGNSIGDNPTTGAFVELTPEGDSVRAISAIGSPYTDGHELQVQTDANGHRVADYLFGYDIRTVDQSAYGGGTADQVAGHQVLRISATGAVDTLMQGWNYWTNADKVDPPITDQSIDHPNSIDFDLDGAPIVSFRNLGAIIKLNTTTHAVVWQLGGARNQFTFVNDPMNGFGGQHSVRVLPNGDLLVFDNGVTHDPQSSRAVEYSLNVSAKTATMVWQYIPSPALFNEFTGSVQRLSNGNTVIAWTNAGLVDEVAPDGTLVNRMQLDNAPGVPNTSAYRAIRINNLYSYAHP